MQPTRNMLLEYNRPQSVLNSHLAAPIDLQGRAGTGSPVRMSTSSHLPHVAAELLGRIAVWVNEGGRGRDENQ